MPLSTKNSNISRLQSLWEPDQDAPAVRTFNNRYGGSKMDETDVRLDAMRAEVLAKVKAALPAKQEHHRL